MRCALPILLSLLPVLTLAQKKTIITTQGDSIEITILLDTERRHLIDSLHGKADVRSRKEHAARTYKLSNSQILIEFYDRQGALVQNETDLVELQEVRFFKTYVDFLKRNITYRIDLSYEKGIELARHRGKLLQEFKSSLPDYHQFEVYQLSTGQLLYLNHTRNEMTAAIFENMKALASQSDDVLAQVYGDIEAAAAKFLQGDPLWDYNPQEFFVWPRDEQTVIKNHRLKLVERKVYVDDFFSNLYQSDGGYYVLLNEFNQKDKRGVEGLGIGQARVYKTLDEVKDARQKYQENRSRARESEHFYRNLSDRFGKEFPAMIPQLIDTMCRVLNIDKSQLTYDSLGIGLVDEAIHWNHDNSHLFNQWFPGALAFYGECYRLVKKDGKWEMRQEKEEVAFKERVTLRKILIPHLALSNGIDAFDSNDFYKTVYEWPTSLMVAGDWSGAIVPRRMLSTE